MRGAFRWLFAHFAGGFILVLIVQVVVVTIGIRVAFSGYADFQRDKLESIARTILTGSTSDFSESLSYTNPFFVFSADGDLVFSNRGRGRSISSDEFEPVYQDGSLIGYFHAGQMKFMDNEANRIFLSTLLLLAGASLIASLAFGVVISIRASRKIAGAVSILRSDIRLIESRTVVNARNFVITELTEISRSLERLSTLLANEENYKRQWMQDIAHDLRTPISSLKGQLEGMRDGVLDWSVERFDKNLTEIDRLQDLVQGISELYTVENADTVMTDSFPAGPFIDEVIAPHEMTKKKKNISVDISMETDSIQGDRRLLLRAIGNIVSNAFAYTGPDGKIEILVQRNGDRCEILVADDGPGIPADQIDKIFHRFFRGEYARNAAGTGLGLNIARAIIERHAGEIIVQNRSTGGACFVVSLPGLEKNKSQQ